MTNQDGLSLLNRVSYRLNVLLRNTQDPAEQHNLRRARLYVKRCWDAAWAVEHPAPDSDWEDNRAMAADADLERGLRALGKY
jgi:hypothetical protein